MPPAVNHSPAETDLLCETCGYILNGLPNTGNCPECGSSIASSTSATPRRPSTWEDISTHPSILLRLAITSAQIIFHPRKFYRNLTVRGESAPALQFARIHWILSSILLGLAAWLHAQWYHETITKTPPPSPLLSIASLLGLILLTYFAISLTTRLAARLTTWEGTYRGLRLPYRVVLRTLHYHAAHFFPVAFFAFATVALYTQLQSRGILQTTSAPAYLYILSAQVILSATYLFNTYWIGMRNLMYANY